MLVSKLGFLSSLRPYLQEWKNYLFMLKQKSKSTADAELTEELSAMTNSEETISLIDP